MSINAHSLAVDMNSSQQAFPMENLDYVLQRMEERTPDNFHLGGSNESFQHGGRARSSTYSTRTLLDSYKDKPKDKCNCCSCKVMAAFVIIALLAWGIAVPVYFLIGPGAELRAEGQIPRSVVAAQRSPLTDGSFLNGTVLNAINGTIRIVNQRFTPNLANHFSAEYQALKLKLETLLSVVFNKKSDFNRAAVIGFRPGSVVVQFVLIFNKNKLSVRHLVSTTLTRYLGAHWSMLGTFQIDIASIDIKNVRNQCAVDNGGCSHLCFWSVLSSGYECRCPQDYRLLNDGKSCFPEMLPKATTTTNPCADDQFLCRSRNCIPNRWLCDGVSDCLLGEDEASHLCQTPLRHLMDENQKKKNKTTISIPSHRSAASNQYQLNQPLIDSHIPKPAVPPAQQRPRPLIVVQEQTTPSQPKMTTSVRTSPAASAPVVVLKRRPVEVISDINPPSLVSKDKEKDALNDRPRSFSFFG